jgi:hypothetical protein
MTASVTGESPVASGCHSPKLIARNAERAANDAWYVGSIDRVRQDYSKVLHPRILFVEY